MKYSLRKSFSFRRRKETREDDHPRVDANGCSNSNSNLVKSNQSKSFLRRQRRYSASPPPPSSPPSKTKSKTCEHRYSNHVNDVDDDDDPFSTSADSKTRVRPFNKLTNQIRKSFRNTLTRQRPRLESSNSNKRLIFNKNEENQAVNHTVVSPVSTGITSQIISSPQTTSDEKESIKVPPKRRKAPLAPTHMNHSVSVPNQDCSALNITDHQESNCTSLPNDQQQNLLTKKNKFNLSFRSRISLLLKKRHQKQQQQQQEQIQNCIDEDPDHQHHDDQDEITNKKQTLSQRFDTLRHSFHLGTRNTSSKGKRHLLSNE